MLVVRLTLGDGQVRVKSQKYSELDFVGRETYTPHSHKCPYHIGCHCLCFQASRGDKPMPGLQFGVGVHFL